MDDFIFRKTASGAAEIEQRQLGLGFKDRQLLILLDGQKTLAELTSLMPLEELLPRLSKLEQAGLISEINHSSATEFYSSMPSPQQLGEILQLLEDADQHFLNGQLSPDLHNTLETATNPLQLRRAIENWFQAMNQAGKSAAAKEILAKIRICLSQ